MTLLLTGDSWYHIFNILWPNNLQTIVFSPICDSNKQDAESICFSDEVFSCWFQLCLKLLWLRLNCCRLKSYKIIYVYICIYIYICVCVYFYFGDWIRTQMSVFSVSKNWNTEAMHYPQYYVCGNRPIAQCHQLHLLGRCSACAYDHNTALWSPNSCIHMPLFINTG